MVQTNALRLLSACLTLVPSVLAWSTGVQPGQIQNLVTFGDSYTDAGAPADGGVAWPTYAAGYGPFNLYPFAKSGAVCSNYLTPRQFPPVFEYQLPAYFNETSNGTIKLDPNTTIYTLWIGTNDVGVGALLTGSDPGVTLVDTIGCAVNWVNALYASGARNFLFQNMLPLQNTILYSANSYPSRYWTAERNTTEWNVMMTELTNSGNQISRLLLSNLAPALPGAHVGLFDSYGLFTDMYNYPANYLNGTAPLNVTGCVHSCVLNVNESTGDPGVCTIANGTDRDSFLWYDELHPSEQSDRIVAREITAAIKRTSEEWTTWFS
ncbi:carbohydrate esterase family 16 protein [Jaapia argillacea MUCL 33604]|uniref:Carbohydrate esterase family 16 protein n=1 Tax=Jaapia argillacea MUCL 33604 TaxID=933084 RepID=A0A067PKT3_9AGAM|nr:carbohydrate esterase family 16 protein [Jaapia argillacea MUCL 33604]